jgi:hypothetical protein
MPPSVRRRAAHDRVSRQGSSTAKQAGEGRLAPSHRRCCFPPPWIAEKLAGTRSSRADWRGGRAATAAGGGAWEPWTRGGATPALASSASSFPPELRPPDRPQPQRAGDGGARPPHRDVPHERALGWNASVPACAWTGVRCDVANTTIVELHLPGIGLVGGVPRGTPGGPLGLLS